MNPLRLKGQQEKNNERERYKKIGRLKTWLKVREAGVVPPGLLSTYTFSLITPLHNTVNCELLLLIYYSLLKKSTMVFICVKKLGKSIFSKRRYLFCLTFNGSHLPINLGLSEVNSPDVLLGLFNVVRSTSSLPFTPIRGRPS